MINRTIEAIVAYDLNRGIGYNNSIPWHHSEDLKWFKALTTNQIVIMGRKTFENICSKGGKFANGLPNRFQIVLSATQQGERQGVYFEGSVEAAIQRTNLIQENNEPFLDYTRIYVIGGESVYRAFMPHTESFWITMMNKTWSCDTWFPQFTYPTKIESQYDYGDHTIFRMRADLGCSS